MVSPIHILTIPLLAVFILPFIEKAGRRTAQLSVSLVIALMTAIPASYLIRWFNEFGLQHILTAAPIIVETAGFRAPFSITVQAGPAESAALLLVNIAALLGTVYLIEAKQAHWQKKQLILYIMILVGTNGLIISRDMFNIFVFLEISSIASYALIASKNSSRSFEAGFKYMVAGSMASILFLLGVIYLYRISGTLSLDQLLTVQLDETSSITALALIMTALLIELKPFPANGWAIDAYDAAQVHISALLSAVTSSGVLFVFYKMAPMFSESLLVIAGTSGMITFLVSHIVGLKQSNVRRMLGYSSSAQIGLLVFIISYGFSHDMMPTLLPAVFLLLATHAISKAGVFWATPLLEKLPRIHEKHRNLLLLSTTIFLMALSALPPFPSFWAKWNVLRVLSGTQNYVWMGAVLAGSLIEAAYLFRWLAACAKNPDDSGDVHSQIIPEDTTGYMFQTGSITSKRALEDMKTLQQADSAQTELKEADTPVSTVQTGTLSGPAPASALGALLIFAAGMAVAYLSVPALLLAPITAVAAGFMLDLFKINVKIQLTISLAALAWYSARIIPSLEGITALFGWMFLIGGTLQLLVLFNRTESSPGLAGLFTALILSLGNLLLVRTRLELFFSWELMSLLAYFLIIRGRSASAASYRYLIFSLGGAYSILMGFMLMPEFSQSAMTAPPIVAVLLAAGLLIKIGSAGFHIWLPGAYAEADDDISGLLSSVLSKAGLYLFFFFASLFAYAWNYISMNELLGWIGVFTAIAGAFLALFQEDIKYTLAYSSMSQMGYMLLSFALMTQLGWITSLYLAITHLLFKSMLFIAIAGVIYRTKTRLMYQQGGLIAKMPISFLTVLIGIIALSGVPPLTGFGGKWMLYTALLEQGWYLQAAAAMFASAIAFLYLFRLIHSIFLGQLKDEHRELREAPVWFLIPQILGMLAIMVFSMFPDLLIGPLQTAIGTRFTETIHWEGYTVISTLGYWNGNAVMYVTMGVFALPLIWLLIMQRRHTRKVKQFNIVFAAERPYRPETTHYAYNFFGFYHTALGSFLTPWTTRFWKAAASVVENLGAVSRRLYTGNMQTYALHIFLFAVIVLLAARGGM
jgi:formate hydrogenlyase subunit 3/multisubunit Na+/H+ antiporter MnhD subunit